MPPPELARDTPVANVPHPLKVRVCPIRRDKLGPAGFHGSEGFFRERLDSNEPLRRQQRLYNRAATLAVSDIMLERFGPSEQSLSVQIFQNALPRFVALESVIGPALRSNFGIFADDTDLSEIVPLAHVEVRRIMRRRDLHHAVPNSGSTTVSSISGISRFIKGRMTV